jgi:hypothetical protein
MARRGTLTALQAALAGIGGAAGGYVQQEELKRKRQEEERQRGQQEFLTRFSLTQAGARPRQAPVPGAPEVPGAPKPSDYQTIGTFGGVEYEALTPEAKALQGRQERAADIETEIGARTTAEAKRWESAKPQVVAALEKIDKRYLPEGIREMALAGGFGMDPSKAVQTAFEIANQNRRTDLEQSRTGAGQTVASIRKDINDKVAQFRSSVMRMEVDVPDPDRIGRTMKVRLKPAEQKQMIDEYRRGLEQDYGLTTSAPDTARGGGSRMSFEAPTGAPSQSNIGTILDRTTTYGAEGPPSPLTWQSRSGKTYKF